MAKKSKTTYLTAGELEILKALWREGPATIAEARRALDRDVAYPTMQTRLNRLVAKQVVARSKTVPSKYRAAVAPEDVSAGHLDLLLDRVTGGSVVPLVAHLVKDRELQPEEIEEMRRLLADAEQASKRTRSKGKQE
jgi:predicted transcriptional regulator